MAAPMAFCAENDHPKIQAALEQWLGSQPGGVAAAYLDSTGVTFFNAGHFSEKNPTPITADTEFEIGSITKVFTALLLADSVIAGKVELDRPVGPPFAPAKITYLQLATHASGLPGLPPQFHSADPTNPYDGQTLELLVKAFDALAPSAKPGPPVYSNFGFAVLGQALAGAWGKTYEALLAQRILQPLGLNDTIVGWRNCDPKRLAPGHNLDDPTSNWDLNAYAPAGTLVSTTRDLSRFLQACLEQVDTPLKQQLAEAAGPAGAGFGKNRQLGLAWVIQKQGESTLVWHNGGTGGYRGFIGYDPTRKTGVVLLTNHTTELDTLGFALLAPTFVPPPRPLDAAEGLREFLGSYPLTPSFVLNITAEGEQLFVRGSNQPRLKLKQSAPDRYKVEGVKAEISFERDRENKIEALTLHQNGANQRGVRVVTVPKNPGSKDIK